MFRFILTSFAPFVKNSVGKYVTNTGVYIIIILVSQSVTELPIINDRYK